MAKVVLLIHGVRMRLPETLKSVFIMLREIPKGKLKNMAGAVSICVVAPNMEIPVSIAMKWNLNL